MCDASSSYPEGNFGGNQLLAFHYQIAFRTNNPERYGVTVGWSHLLLIVIYWSHSSIHLFLSFSLILLNNPLSIGQVSVCLYFSDHHRIQREFGQNTCFLYKVHGFPWRMDYTLCTATQPWVCNNTDWHLVSELHSYQTLWHVWVRTWLLIVHFIPSSSPLSCKYACQQEGQKNHQRIIRQDYHHISKDRFQSWLVPSSLGGSSNLTVSLANSLSLFNTKLENHLFTAASS